MQFQANHSIAPTNTHPNYAPCVGQQDAFAEHCQPSMKCTARVGHDCKQRAPICQETVCQHQLPPRATQCEGKHRIKGPAVGGGGRLPAAKVRRGKGYEIHGLHGV